MLASCTIEGHVVILRCGFGDIKKKAESKCRIQEILRDAVTPLTLKNRREYGLAPLFSSLDPLSTGRNIAILGTSNALKSHRPR